MSVVKGIPVTIVLDVCQDYLISDTRIYYFLGKICKDFVGKVKGLHVRNLISKHI